MPSALQIGAGVAFLILCAALHLFVAAQTLEFLRHRGLPEPHNGIRGHIAATAGVFLVFSASPTLQIYFWALSFLLLGALPSFSEAIYFALVTYTTLGYGDVTLSPEFRIFGAMAAITGVLMFGVITAFLVGFVGRLMGQRDDGRK